jgi:hypothetical protein
VRGIIGYHEIIFLQYQSRIAAVSAARQFEGLLYLTVEIGDMYHHFRVGTFFIELPASDNERIILEWDNALAFDTVVKRLTCPISIRRETGEQAAIC